MSGCSGPSRNSSRTSGQPAEIASLSPYRFGPIENLYRFLDDGPGVAFEQAAFCDFAEAERKIGWSLFRRIRSREPAPAGLRLLGPVGTGKTHFAAAMARCWVLDGRSCRFVQARRLFREVRDTYNSNATETEVIEANLTPELLVIDDLGREGRPSEQVLSVLHEIIDGRLSHRRFTIVTTNLGDDLTPNYGEAIASRIDTYATLVLSGADRRRP